MSYVEIVRLKQNDCLYNLPLQCQASAGTAVDITGYATLKLMVYEEGASTCKFETETDLTVDDEATGKLHYEVQDGDFDEVATYRAELEVTFGTGKVLTFPDFIIEVEAEAPETP